MPHENGDQDCNQHDNHDAERCRSASAFAIAVHYNRAISHTGSCSFRRCSAPLIPKVSKHYPASKRSPAAMWSAAGLLMCAVLIAAASLKSKSAAANFYAHHVYGMTLRTHAAYAAMSLAFAAAFAASYFVALPVVLLLGAYTLVFIFYFSSFARGFSDEE